MLLSSEYAKFEVMKAVEIDIKIFRDVRLH
jgi:hypothetical protein